ncbi:MAG: STAS domain-containing protein [Polyangiales bacterium]
MNAELMHQILERLPGAVFCARMDPVTQKSEWLSLSDRAIDIWEVALAELIADAWAFAKYFPPEQFASMQAAIAVSLDSGTPLVWLGYLIRPNGEVRWVHTFATVEREADGNVLGYGQTLDVTDRKQLEQSLRDSEAERAKSEALYRQVLDALPVGVMVTNEKNEFLVMNPAHVRIIGGVAEHPDGDVAKAYGLFHADGVTPLPMQDTGMARGLRGESLEEEIVMRNPRLSKDARLHVQWTPLKDADGAVFAAVGTTQDITLQRELENDLRLRNQELAASEAGKAELIERLRYSIDELSNPILEVWDDVLAMPLIGVVDSRRAAEMVPRLLGEVARTQASFVIIDLTGVEIVDTKTADHLVKLMRKVEVVGARCVLTGIRPAVAETLVDIGVDFGRLVTLRNLKHGLREALRSSRQEKAGRQRLELDDASADDTSASRPG